MGVKRTLVDNLSTILGEITDIDHIAKIPELDPSGYPYVLIADSDIASDYESSQENIRTYAFKVWVVGEYDTTDYETAYNLQRDISDAIMDKIDEQESPNSGRELATGLANGYTLVGVRATPGITINDTVEKALATELTVRCMILVDLTQLS